MSVSDELERELQLLRTIEQVVTEREALRRRINDALALCDEGVPVGVLGDQAVGYEQALDAVNMVLGDPT